MNQVSLIGRIVRDPEVRYTTSGMANCKFTLAVSRGKDKNGNEGVDYPQCVAWGKQAEAMERYVKKGQQLGITGRIQTGSYERDGRKVYTTEVYCTSIEFLGKAESSGSAPAAAPSDNTPSGIPEGFEALSDDCPF